MAFVTAVGEVAEVQMRGTFTAAGSTSKFIFNIFHFRLATLAAAPTKTALATIFNTNIRTPFLAAANVRYDTDGTDVRCINDATDVYQSFITAPALQGAIATDSEPVTTCVSMLYRTGLRGKNYRGAKRFAGVNEVDTTGDVLTGAGLVRWQTLQTALAANMTDALGNVWVPCVVSRSLSQLVANPTTVVNNDVVAVLLNLNIGTMRGRRVATVR